MIRFIKNDCPVRSTWLRAVVLATLGMLGPVLIQQPSVTAQDPPAVPEAAQQPAQKPAVKEAAPEAGDPLPPTSPPTSSPPLPTSESPSPSGLAGSAVGSAEATGEAREEPWDFSPYRVLVWIASDDPRVNAASLEKPLRTYFDLDFAAIWRIDIADAPVSVRSVATRDIGSFTYDLISASDPVIAVKRDHPDAVRIRVVTNVGSLVTKVLGTTGRINEVKRRAVAAGNESMDGAAARLLAIDGDESAVGDHWKDAGTEAILVSRGMALTLKDPVAKLVQLPISGLVGQATDSYDKIFVVHVNRQRMPNRVSAIEMDTLMRHFGPVATEWSDSPQGLVASVGRAVTRAFAPVVRIDNAGQRNASGLVRAGGLILDSDKNSPARVGKDDVLEPMTRKNDRNGKPILIGPIDWAYLYATEADGPKITMDYYSGRPGGLQGRKNKRTFRMALKVRPFGDNTLIRLHAKGDVDFPLIGYEIYERELTSRNMTFVGRTDWNGRLTVERKGVPLKLLYVKNGGAVLARLPTVPGLTAREVADISGDDMRLQAEAYIRGIQNAIIDLVAIRELFKARIMLRLKRGEMEKAQALLKTLRSQPSNEKLANDMGRKQDQFIRAIGRNPNQLRKVDEMFKITKELLAKHINTKLVTDLELTFNAARKNGGKLVEEPDEDDAQDDSES